MTVYVDNALIPYGRMQMSHMIADTEEELHQMADDIGVKRKCVNPKCLEKVTNKENSRRRSKRAKKANSKIQKT